MEFGKQLAKYREENQIDQKDIAKLLEITPQTVSNYETGKNKIPYEKLIMLCNYYKKNPLDFIKADLNFDLEEIKQEEKKILSAYKNLTDSDRRVVDFILDIKQEKPIQYSDNTNRLINLGEIISIDTYPQPVSAGKGNIYIDDNPVPKLYPATPTSSKADYCARISGDSMYPDYLDGDFVYVDKTKELNNDDIGIFFYDGEAYCKKYYEDKNIKNYCL